MTKRNGIPQPEVVKAMDEVLSDLFDVKVQQSFMKITGPNKHRLYVSTSPVVRQVDISFPVPEDAPWQSLTRARRENGNVHAELDTEHPNFLSDLKDVILWMATAETPPATSRRERFVPRIPIIAQRRAQSGATEEPDEVDVEGEGEAPEAPVVQVAPALKKQAPAQQ